MNYLIHPMSEIRKTARDRYMHEVTLDVEESRDQAWLNACPAVQDGREPSVGEMRWAREMGYEWRQGRFEKADA